MRGFKTLGSESILIRLGICIGMVVILAMLSITVSAIFSERSSGKAQAINLAGSLRMQAYVVSMRLQQARLDGAPALEDLQRAVAAFSEKLSHPRLLADLTADAQDPTRQALQEIDRDWRQRVAPGLLAAARGERPMAEALRQIDALVVRIDDFVRVLERETERRFRLLRLMAALSLAVILMVIAVTVFLMHIQVYQPITDLLRCARAVRDGDFSVRARHTEADELGQFGAAFNTMLDELSRTYAGLESRVTEKTRELARSNESLELLYGVARRLAAREVDRTSLLDVLGEVERVLELPAGAICACDPEQRRGLPLAERGSGPVGVELCRADLCQQCIGSGRAGVRAVTADGGARIVAIALTEGGRHYGMMPLLLPAGRELHDWQWQLLEAVGGQIGAALATARRREDRHRLALFEERSVIARELHDSLAQSLSYLKIQVARLQAMLGAQGVAQEVSDVVAELRGGLSSAYRQLRELLTTFRLRMDGRGLAAALEDTVREFRERAAVAIELDNRLLGVELGSNEEIHVLQVIREALSNVEHHARARQVRVCLERCEADAIRVSIEDDGVGLGGSTAALHHFGLTIMRDRAQSLGGTLTLEPRAQGGTRVALVFRPTSAAHEGEGEGEGEGAVLGRGAA